MLFVVSFSQVLFAQKGEDPVLFSIENTPVHLSEFKYIYTKTNGEKADFSKASLKEYLDLYTNFKLKVRKAKDMKLDTIVSLQQELAGYRRQLADSYLIDRQVTEKLVEEVYERTKQDVDLSHIMIKFPDNPTPADTLQAWNKALEAKEKLENGESFDDIAITYSNDQSVSKNKGHIGYVTALFPNGFYALETAAYEGPIGKIQGPVRTIAGYHILLIHDRRPARGEIEVAHILVRNDKYPNMIKVRERIDSISNLLIAGGDFEALARFESDDKITSSKGGYIGFFGINRFEKVFEDAAFSLEKDGDFTGPVQTSIGWHIIKRISLKRDEPFPMVKSRLQNQIKGDQRFELARENMIGRIKKESNFSENRTTLKNIIATLTTDTTESFLTYKWKAPENPSKEQLFSFGSDMKITVGDFEDYLERASRKRQQMARQGITTVTNILYKDFVDESALKLEERQLEAKYPEFKSLMREYEEGVLLFEVTKMEVWDKASLDTVGLQKFFDENKDKYHWDERAVVSQYTLVNNAKDKINLVREFAAKNPAQKVLEGFNTGAEVILTVQERKYEKGRNDLLDMMNWEIGELSVVEISKRDRSSSFLKIEEFLPAGPKTLQEARGYIVADYQDFLEKKWLEDLMKTYKVKVNEKVFNSMVRKG